MKTLKVKSLAYLLSFLMILGLMPITTYATAPTRLVVNGTDILTAANNTVQCGEGTAKYDSDSNTLTLENATITEGDTYNGAAIYAPTGDLNIHLVDKNEIESTRNFMVVYASSGSIEITGQGMLTVESNDTCIWAGGGGVTVSGATLNLTSTSSNGIYANNSNETASIVIKDKAHVTIDASNFGMACSGNLSILNSTVIASASGDSSNVFYSWEGEVVISNSTVQAKGTSDGAYPTIYAENGISIFANSNVIASSPNSNALFSPNTITVSDSVLEAKSTGWAVWSNSSIEISGSTVKTYDTGGEYTNASLHAGTTLTVSNSSDVLADGGIEALDGITVTPANGKLVEYKAGVHENGESGTKHRGNSPYDTEFSFSNDDIELGYTYVHIKDHVHTYGDEWSLDDTHHWHACTCGEKADQAPHSFTWIVESETAVSETGHEKCAVCGYEKATVKRPKTAPVQPTYDDLSKGDSDHTYISATIKCIEDGTTCYKTEYPLFENKEGVNSYSLGEVTWDAARGQWYCDVTIYAEAYIKNYSKTSRAKYTLHELAEGEPTSKTIRFWYMDEFLPKNPWRTEDGYSGTQRKITFHVVHTKISRTIICKAENITKNSVELSAEVSQLANEYEVIYYAMSDTPDVVPAAAEFSFFSSFEDLKPDTTYYFWAKVKKNDPTGLLEAVSQPLQITTDHDWDTAWSGDDIHHWHDCTAEGCTLTDNSQKLGYGVHAGGTATCHTKAVCGECGKEYGAFDAANHEGDTEVRDARAATCTEDGYTGDIYCLGCGEKIAEGSLIPATGHTMTHHERVEATCTTAGSVEYWSCSECGKIFSDENDTKEITDTVLPATGHTLTHHERVEATCTTAGSVEYWSCSVCSKNFSDENGADEITDTVLPATGHTLTQHERVEATCTTAGNVEYWSCSVCGKNFSDENGVDEIADTVLPATGHTLTQHERVEATCITAGNVEYWNCSVCGKNFSDENGVDEIIDIVLPATDHTYGGEWSLDDIHHWHECACGARNDEAVHRFKWIIDKEATETEKGSKHEECEVCGYKKAAIEIPATGGGTIEPSEPTKPVEPTEPTEPDDPSKPTTPSAPQTGDSSNLLIWFMALIFAASGLMCMAFYNRKKNRNIE